MGVDRSCPTSTHPLTPSMAPKAWPWLRTAMWWLQTLGTTVSRSIGTCSDGGQLGRPFRRSCTMNWNGFLGAGPEYTRLFMLEGIIGELSKVISECNNFLKNCVSDFCNWPLGLKKERDLFYWIYKNCKVSHLWSMAYRTGIYVVKLILQIKQALKENLEDLKVFVNLVNGSLCTELPKTKQKQNLL